MQVVRPDWGLAPRVQALVTTRATGDLRALLPGEPVWLKQVHATGVVEADRVAGRPEADASFTRATGVVCVVGAADCMPVLLAQDDGSVVGAAHAGWRGLCAGVIEATLDAMQADPARTLAWLGPAIGPQVYEVGEEVHAAYLERDAGAAAAFKPTRPGHWLLDLYAVARQRLAARGVLRVSGGGFCTYTDVARFHSYRRDRTTERMAAMIWIAE
ncbi:MAG: peptidoglycan editing factor PgeF [Betaproteobacteria bacterium]|nr:peptidoglycan editing factor PgeF [Betaproteobacteria bacterium]